jgi:hypothetical protein
MFIPAFQSYIATSLLSSTRSGEESPRSSCVKLADPFVWHDQEEAKMVATHFADRHESSRATPFLNVIPA